MQYRRCRYGRGRCGESIRYPSPGRRTAAGRTGIATKEEGRRWEAVSASSRPAFSLQARCGAARR